MNKTLLQVNTSLFSDAGQSSTLANEFVAGWKKRNPGAAVIKRDLAKEPVPHLTAERFQAFITKPFDTQSAYLKNFLALIGITKVEFVYAEGIAMGATAKDAAMAQAKKAIAQLNAQTEVSLAA